MPLPSADDRIGRADACDREIPEQDKTPVTHLLVWGTYDIGKPRVRILLRGLRDMDVAVTECHVDLWSGIEDKSQLRGIRGVVTQLARWLATYPSLLLCFLRLPRYANVLVPYMGHVDLLLLWPFAKLRGSRVIWDAFLSIYNTVVEDRAMLSARNPLAWGVYAIEWVAARAADRIVLDTAAHADYFARRYGIPRDKLVSVIVGAEQEHFPRAPPLAPPVPGMPARVLFYGQFIPLHGIQTIIRAAHRLDDGSIEWVLIGRGQEADNIRRMLAEAPVRHLTWIPWVEYDQLIHQIAAADVCLGIFGASDKAARVIPNKVFQVLSAGRPLITRDSPALLELVPGGAEGLYLVPPEDPAALVAALGQFQRDRARLAQRLLFADLRARISTSGVGREFRNRVLLDAEFQR